MASTTDLQERRAPSGTQQWFRGHVLTRAFATVWWVLVVGITVALAVSVVDLALDPSPGAVASVAIMVIVFVPVWREWPNWRRMARMLRHGT